MDLKFDLLCLASHERGMSNNPTQNLAVQHVWKPGAKSLWKCTCHGQIFAHANGSLEIEIGEENTPFPPLQPASVNIAFDILAKQCSLSPFWIFCLHGSQSRDCADLPSPSQFIALIQPDVRVSRFGRRPMLWGYTSYLYEARHAVLGLSVLWDKTPPILFIIFWWNSTVKYKTNHNPSLAPSPDLTAAPIFHKNNQLM